MRKLMTKQVTVIVLVLGTITGVISQDGPTKDESLSKKYLAQIKSLAGTWKGPFEWTGAMSGKGNVTVEYYTTGYGTSVVEDIISEDGAVSMSSVYHMDAEDLRMTHYCAANNHPRLIAGEMDRQGRSVDFDMVDITNLKSEDAGHVYGVRLEFVDDENLNIKFKYRRGDDLSLETIQLTKINQNQ